MKGGKNTQQTIKRSWKEAEKRPRRGRKREKKLRIKKSMRKDGRGNARKLQLQSLEERQRTEKRKGSGKIKSEKIDSREKWKVKE